MMAGMSSRMDELDDDLLIKHHHTNLRVRQSRTTRDSLFTWTSSTPQEAYRLCERLAVRQNLICLTDGLRLPAHVATQLTIINQP